MTRKKKYIERVRITGKAEEQEKALASLDRGGYAFKYMGCPRTPGRNRILIDTSRFFLVGERDMARKEQTE